MTRKILITVLLVGWFIPSAMGDPAKNVKRTFRIDLSALHTLKMQDWSGRAKISKGRITKVDKTSGMMDTVHPDMSWTIVYGRSIKTAPKKQPAPKALLISVAAPESAVVTVTTKAGEFSFRVDEIPPTKKIERLGGNVLVSIGSAKGKGGGRGKGKKPGDLPGAKIAGEIPAERITGGKKQSEWPAAAVSESGATWIAYVEWNGKDSDRVMVVRRPKGGKPAAAVCLDDGGWDHYWPAVGVVGETAVVVWSGQKDGNFDLHWALVGPDGKASAPKRLTDTPQTDFHARIVPAGPDALLLVYQSFRKGQSDIFARRFAGGTWGEEVRVSESPQNDWQPAVAVDKLGSAWISWDSYDRGNYDVFLRRLDAKGLGPVIPITSEPTAQYHSSVAVDGRGRVWVAWDDGGLNWGKDLSTSSAAEGNKGLHASRTIAARVYANGTVHDPAAQPAAAFSGAMTRYAELPQLATDGRGGLWMIFRHWTIKRPTEMFHVYATKLTAEGWSTPWKLANSSGRNSQWTSPAPVPGGGLCVAYASDGRAPDNLPKDQIHSLIYSAYTAALEPGEEVRDVKLTETKLPESTTVFAKRVRPTMRIGATEYTLLMGDCHRHTDIRGHSAVDGSIMDTFRYALDPAQLDYMGLGDHNEIFGGRWPDGIRDYQWWWTQKAVDLFTALPTFVGMYSYEHSMSSPGGHRNIIFLKRGAPLRAVDRGGKGADNPANQPPKMWEWVRKNVLTQPGQKCVIVPHTFASGPLASWNWPNAEFDCLLEIYQGCRGSYEKWNQPPAEKRGGTQTKKPGHFAQDALKVGNIYGFVSFSDHRSTHNSWGCVWVDRVGREPILDAMLARRTYAATDEMIVKLRVGENHTMGQIFDAPANKPLSFHIDIAAPDTIRRVDVIKNGNYIWTKNPKAKTFQVTFQDMDVKPGKAYYYIRVFQRDPEKPEGDSEIAWSSPVFVTFK